MKNKYDILLIAPNYGVYGQYYSFPIGLACISSSLKHAGFKVKCLNLNHYEDEDKIIEDILSQNDIKIVATGGLSAHINNIQSLRNKFKKYTDMVFILGGGILSSEPTLIFEELDIDYGVLHEGEETILELVDYILNKQLKIEDINGIVYRKSNKVTMTMVRDSINDLNSLPFPDYDGFEIEEYLDNQMPNDDFSLSVFDNPRMIPAITTRSCPFSCTFCYHPLGKKYRVTSLNYFFEWLDDLIKKYNVNMLDLSDELFSANKERMHEFARRIKPLNLKWTAAMRVTDIDDETLEMLSDSGLYAIQYGIESASDIVLKSMKKKIKMVDVDNALTLTRKHNIGIQANLIFGDVAESKSTYKESLDWWVKNKKHQIMLSSISAYPGTPIYIDAIQNGKIQNVLQFIKDGCPQINLTTMNDNEYIQMRQDIIDSIYEHKLHPKVLKSTITGSDIHRGALYSIDLICPHCEKENNYKNMHKVETFVNKVCCRHCNQKFDVKMDEMYCDYAVEDTYFLNSKRAIIVAKQNNILNGKLQNCFYEGEIIYDLPVNCINVPYQNFKKFFLQNTMNVPTKIEFGLASFMRDRRTIEREFANMRTDIINERKN